MTHDELLVKIDKELKLAEFEDMCGDGGHPSTHRALRAVVELHRRLPEHKDSPFKDSCFGCGRTYPCKTIQAIEKELA